MTNDPQPINEVDDPDLSDFGNLVPVFSNRCYVYAGKEVSKIFFGEMMKPSGESFYHTSVTVRTEDLIGFMKLIAQLTGHRVEAQEESESDG